MDLGGPHGIRVLDLSGPHGIRILDLDGQHRIRILDLGGPRGIRILDFKMLQCMLRTQGVEYANRIHLAQDRKQWRAYYGQVNGALHATNGKTNYN